MQTSYAVAVLKKIRIKQWVKNFLLFVPFIASGEPLSIQVVRLAIAGFCFFSFISSLNYMVNDHLDRLADSHHPHKRHRVEAALRLKKSGQLILILILITFATTIYQIATLPNRFYVITVLYCILTNAYTFFFKIIPIIELIFVASGFFLRVLAGGALFNISISHWLVMVSASGALLVVILKRLGEYQSSIEEKFKREVLKSYSEDFLEGISIVALAATLIGYCLWAFEGTSSGFMIQFSVIPFIITLFHLLLIHKTLAKRSIEDVLLSSKVIIFSQILVFVLIYLNRRSGF